MWKPPNCKNYTKQTPRFRFVLGRNKEVTIYINWHFVTRKKPDLSPCCRYIYTYVYWYYRGGGIITKGIEGGGIVEIREGGVGDFNFGKLTVIVFNFQKFCPPETDLLLRRLPVGGRRRKMVGTGRENIFNLTGKPTPGHQNYNLFVDVKFDHMNVMYDPEVNRWVCTEQKVIQWNQSHSSRRHKVPLRDKNTEI